MALIVEYHVLADMYGVGATAISAGMLVEQNAQGLVIPVTGANNTNTLGVAGDSALAAEGQTTVYSAEVTLGADGASTRFTENRVSDFYDETAASAKITVYQGGGKFWISNDLVGAASAAPAVGDLLESSDTAGCWDVGATAGEVVGLCVSGVTSYPSGVPGTDVDGSITLGDYFAVALRI